MGGKAKKHLGTVLGTFQTQLSCVFNFPKIKPLNIDKWINYSKSVFSYNFQALVDINMTDLLHVQRTKLLSPKAGGFNFISQLPEDRQKTMPRLAGQLIPFFSGPLYVRYRCIYIYISARIVYRKHVFECCSYHQIATVTQCSSPESLDAKVHVEIPVDRIQDFWWTEIIHEQVLLKQNMQSRHCKINK